MIWLLLRQDPAARAVPGLVLVGLLAGVPLRLAMGPVLDSPGLEIPEQALRWINFSRALVWVTLAMTMLSANFMTRCSRMALALPVRARTLWWTRMASILYTGLVPVVLATLVVAVRIPGDGAVRLSTFVLLQGAHVAVGLVLAGLLFQSPEPSLYAIRRDPGYVFYVGFIGLVILLSVLHGPRHWLWIVVPLVIAVLLALRLHLSIPRSFVVFPREPEPHPDLVVVGGPGVRYESERPGMTPVGDSSVAEAGVGEGRRPERSAPAARDEATSRWTVHWLVFRALVNHWTTWLLAPMLCLYGGLLVNGFVRGEDPVAYLLFVAAWPFAIGFHTIIRLYRLDYLPISRRILFPYASLPAVLAVVIGAAVAGIIFVFVPGAEGCEVCYGKNGVQVPPEFWEIAWDGRPPSIESPWGETLEPSPRKVIRWGRIAVYNPYETREDSSPRFVSLQASRAVQRVHGLSRFKERAVAYGGADSLVETPTRTEEDRRDIPIEASRGRGSPVRNRTFGVGLFLLLWVWTAVSLVGLRQFHSTPNRKVYRVGFIVLIVALALGYITVALAEPLRLAGATSAGSFTMVFFMVLFRRIAEAVPLGTVGFWALIVASAICCYLLLQESFVRLEAPLGKLKPVWKEYG